MSASDTALLDSCDGDGTAIDIPFSRMCSSFVGSLPGAAHSRSIASDRRTHNAYDSPLRPLFFFNKKDLSSVCF